MLLTYVHGGGLYRRDLRNRVICTCWFVVTTVITSAWLLGLHMQRNLLLFITTQTGGCDTLWAWGKTWLCKSRLRLGMICCRGCLAWSWSFRNGGNSGMSCSIGVAGMEASSGRRVTFMMDNTGSGRMWSVSLGTWCHPVRVNFLTTTHDIKISNVATFASWV